MLTPKPRAGPLISPLNQKISHLFNKQTVEDQDPIALRDLSDAAVRTVVGARRAGATMVGPTIVVMAGAGDIGAIVGGKPELQESEGPPQLAASFISRQSQYVAYWHLADIRGAAPFRSLLGA